MFLKILMNVMFQSLSIRAEIYTTQTNHYNCIITDDDVIFAVACTTQTHSLMFRDWDMICRPGASKQHHNASFIIRSENLEKGQIQSYFPRARVDNFKLLGLFGQHSKTQRQVHYHKLQSLVHCYPDLLRILPRRAV